MWYTKTLSQINQTQIILNKKILTSLRFHGNIFFTGTKYGSLAQLGEHLPYKQGVIGSSPIVSTKYAACAAMNDEHGTVNN